MARRHPSRWTVGLLGGALSLPLLLVAAPAAVFGETPAAPAAQATPVSPQPTPVSPQLPGPPREMRFYAVAPRFEAYYTSVDGFRTMGRALSPLVTNGLPAQYFEKARLEDHTAIETRPEWQFQYGLLVDELAAVRALVPVGGDRSSMTYNEIALASDPANRVPPPAGFTGGVSVLPNGDVFIPFSANLEPAAGHMVPRHFWEYINREDLFPGGWLHDVGLPTTVSTPATVDKGIVVDGQVVRVTNRPISVQAFQRTILTYDAANPEGWQVERANVGTDYWAVFPDRVPQ
jgi:hypothetical protein